MILRDLQRFSAARLDAIRQMVFTRGLRGDQVRRAP
jgi:hypothetical protein